MTPKSVADERTQKEKFFDRWFRVAEVANEALKKDKDISHILDGLQLLAENKQVTAGIKKEASVDWLTKILTAERRAHRAFFGGVFDLTEFANTLKKYGRKKVRFWRSLGLEPHFLPRMSMLAGNDYDGWKIKPEEWFFKKQVEGKLFRNVGGELKKILTLELEGITVLIDTRLKPVYDNGRQMWENDNLLGEIIESARKSGRIEKYENGQQSSRFGVSANEWEVAIRPALAAKLGLEINQVRLETTTERNAIPQIYPHMPRKDDGKTDTSVWVEENLESRDYRLNGGNSVHGGLARVGYFGAGHHWSSGSFRSLAVLSLGN